GALILGACGVIRYCNDALLRMLGVSKAQIIGRNVRELLAGDDAHLPQQLLGPESRSVESGLRAQSGETVPVHISSVLPMSVDGRTIYGLVITDLRRHEPRLRHNALLQASKDAIYALSPSLQI